MIALRQRISNKEFFCGMILLSDKPLQFQHANSRLAQYAI